MRRQATRYTINHPIELTLSTERHHVVTQDLSRTGMFLAMATPLPIGTVVRIAMPEADRKLHTRGTVVHSVGAPAAEALGRLPGIGIALREPCEPADELFGIGIEHLVRRSSIQPVHPRVRSALCGDLATIGLPALLTLLEHERKTGRVVLTRDHTVWIDIVEGRIVDAGSTEGRHDVRHTVMAVLDWAHGRFEFVPCELASGTVGLMPITHLLLEHARTRDEAWSEQRRVALA